MLIDHDPNIKVFLTVDFLAKRVGGWMYFEPDGTNDWKIMDTKSKFFSLQEVPNIWCQNLRGLLEDMPGSICDKRDPKIGNMAILADYCEQSFRFPDWFGVTERDGKPYEHPLYKSYIAGIEWIRSHTTEQLIDFMEKECEWKVS